MKIFRKVFRIKTALQLLSTMAVLYFTLMERIKDVREGLTVYICYNVSENRNKLVSQMFHNTGCNYNQIKCTASYSLINKNFLVLADCCGERRIQSHYFYITACPVVFYSILTFSEGCEWCNAFLSAVIKFSITCYVSMCVFSPLQVCYHSWSE